MMSLIPRIQVSCEWGEWGVRSLAPLSDVVIIVDVLSFSTCVEVAASRGATVLPYPWKDESARTFAREKDALLAGKRGERYSLSPVSLLQIPEGARLVLPSPNGATLSLATGGKPTLCGCLRNASAVAQAATKLGKRIAVIPAGERWPDNSLRPAFEDWVGAGAIIEHLPSTSSRSPEAQAAMVAWQSSTERLLNWMESCPSGQELIDRGYGSDVEMAAVYNTSRCVPVLRDGGYQNV